MPGVPDDSFPEQRAGQRRTALAPEYMHAVQVPSGVTVATLRSTGQASPSATILPSFKIWRSSTQKLPFLVQRSM